MVRADLERLVPPHDEADLLRLGVLQHADVARATLLPLGVGREPEELGAPASERASSSATKFLLDTPRCAACSTQLAAFGSLRSRAHPRVLEQRLNSFPPAPVFDAALATPARGARSSNSHLEQNLLVLLQAREQVR